MSDSSLTKVLCGSDAVECNAKKLWSEYPITSKADTTKYFLSLAQFPGNQERQSSSCQKERGVANPLNINSPPEVRYTLPRKPLPRSSK